MNRNQIIAGMIAGLIIVYVSASIVVEKRLHDLRLQVDGQYEAQQELVLETARLLSKGSVNEVVAEIVPECPSGDSLRYDDLLSVLDKGLNRTDLASLQTLFNRCGDVASSRRSGMSLYLSDQVGFLTQLSSLRILLGMDVDTESLSDWVILVEKEREISRLFIKLVSAQGSIIDTLVDNVTPTDAAVENIRASAQIVREDLNVLTGEASELRKKLIN